MTTTVAAVDEEVQRWLDRKGIKISPYRTVRLIKVVESDGRSNRSGPTGRIEYTPGTTVTAPDYDRVPGCGNGLHFAATAQEAQSIVGCRNPRFLVCDVDVETLVVIRDGINKVKAEFCHVRFEGTEADVGRFA